MPLSKDTPLSNIRNNFLLQLTLWGIGLALIVEFGYFDLPQWLFTWFNTVLPAHMPVFVTTVLDNIILFLPFLICVYVVMRCIVHPLLKQDNFSSLIFDPSKVDRQQQPPSNHTTMWSWLLGFLGGIINRCAQWRWFYFLTASMVYAATIAFSFLMCSMIFHFHWALSAMVLSTPFVYIQFAAAILLSTPFQCFAEELVFRGYLLRMSERLCRLFPLNKSDTACFKRVAKIALILITNTILFTLAHQNFISIEGFLPVLLIQGMFGLLATYITLRTGGIEASTGMHCANNVIFFLMPATFSITAPITFEFNLVTTVMMTLFTVSVSLIIMELILAQRKDTTHIMRTLPPPTASQTFEGPHLYSNRSFNLMPNNTLDQTQHPLKPMLK